MKLLAIDTSGACCSAALYHDGCINQRLALAPRQHGELILGMMEALLAEAGLNLAALDAVAYGRGPGAFTGVRIAVAVAQGVAFGAELPTIGVSTLAALAHRAWRQYGARRVLAALDARIDEIYWGVFAVTDQGLVSEMCPEEVGPAAAVSVPAAGIDWGVGDGWLNDRALLAARAGVDMAHIDAALAVTAEDIAMVALHAARQGALQPPEQALPVYLRDRVVG